MCETMFIFVIYLKLKKVLENKKTNNLKTDTNALQISLHIFVGGVNLLDSEQRKD